jgi:mRNA interferase MazF
MEIRRFDIWIADLGQSEGCEQRGVRPVLIVQNDVGNRFSPTVIVASITDGNKKWLPTHVYSDIPALFLKPSAIMFEQIRTIDKSKLQKCVGVLDESLYDEANDALKISVGLAPVPRKVDVVHA